ncbi:MAG: hypothetical protein OEQ25_12960 [Gammaproteobacteria bacterium]|nr:hypothetical protein [Gammaproteobacteria bacterium]MDH3508037.1 hypothetical protein [Gammaproteobacteria bacterium]
MIVRYLIALIGGLIITIGLLVFMSGMTERYVMDDPIRYFQIMDVFIGPDRGRQRVRPPSDPRLAPDVPDLEFDPLEERPVLDPEESLNLDPQIIQPAVVPESA